MGEEKNEALLEWNQNHQTHSICCDTSLEKK